MAIKVRFASTTGQSYKVEIERLADGYLYDNNDSTFKASPTTPGLSMPEVAGKAGRYAVNVTTPAGQFTDGDYIVYVTDTNASNATVATLLTTIVSLSDVTVTPPTVAQVWTTAQTEAYAALATAPTPYQFLCMIWSRISQMSLSGDILTTKKLDGTSAMTFQADDPTNVSTFERVT